MASPTLTPFPGKEKVLRWRLEEHYPTQEQNGGGIEKPRGDITTGFS